MADEGAERGLVAGVRGAARAHPVVVRLVALLVAGAVVAATAVWVAATQRVDDAVRAGLVDGQAVGARLTESGLVEDAAGGVDVTDALALVAVGGGYDRVSLHSVTTGELAGVGASTTTTDPAALDDALSQERAVASVVEGVDGRAVRTLVPLLRVEATDGIVLETVRSLAPVQDDTERAGLIAALGVVAATLLALVPLSLFERHRDRRLREQSGALAGMLARDTRAYGDVNDVQQLKTDFLTGVSHGLRTTLQVIHGNAQMLANHGENLTADQRASISERVAAQAERFDDLIRDLLEVEELAEGRPARLRTRVLVGDVLRAVRESVDLGDHRLEAEVPPVIARMAPAHLERILLHLVRNAVHHTPPGSTIRVSARRGDAGTELIVEDDGPGIPAAERLLVFDPLSRGRGGHADPDPGLGLGLAIVRRVTHLYGGRAWIDDAPGGGASVHVWIPDEGGRVGVDPFNLPGSLDVDPSPPTASER